MNIKAQDISGVGKKIEAVINVLPPKAKTVVVILGAGAAFCLSLSEVCKSMTIFAKEGLPPMVENLNKGINMLKQGNIRVVTDDLGDIHSVDESSAA